MSEIVYVPGGGDIDRAVRIGAAWLREQEGDKLVLLPTIGAYRNNDLLPQLTKGAKVAKPGTAWKVSWHGGPVLAPWPTEDVLAEISDGISGRITAVCILEWGIDGFLRSWIRAQNGTDLATGRAASGGEDLLAPVVTAAMEDMSETVNHANGLVQTFDKEYAIQTLQELVHAGHTYEVDNLVAWALAHGFTGREALRLRDYATKALHGHRFRQVRKVLGDNAVERWGQKAGQK